MLWGESTFDAAVSATAVRAGPVRESADAARAAACLGAVVCGVPIASQLAGVAGTDCVITFTSNVEGLAVERVIAAATKAGIGFAIGAGVHVVIADVPTNKLGAAAAGAGVGAPTELGATAGTNSATG